MRQIKDKKSLLWIVVLAVCFGIAKPSSVFVAADTMSSSSFKIPADVMSVGGGAGSSTSFKIDDTLGDLSTGENLTSTNFRGCAGYECFIQSPYLSFTVNTGLTAPGVPGGTVALGTLTTSAVTGSDHTAINSIFLTAGWNTNGGAVVTVRSANGALKSISNLATINSSSATLVAGTAGYGACVASATSLTVAAPYNGTCNTTVGHQVGAVLTTASNLLSATGQLASGSAEVLVKSAISTGTAAAPDYADDLTFVLTATY